MSVQAKGRDLKRQIDLLHKDLLAFKARVERWFDRIDGRFDRIDGRSTKIEGRFDRLERGLRELRRDMPKIVRRAVREALGSKRQGKS